MLELGRFLMIGVVLVVWLAALCAVTYSAVHWLMYGAVTGTAADAARRELAEALAVKLVDRQLDEALAEHGRGE